jgi:hypothetical protein
MAMNYGLGENLNEAVKYSFVPNTFTVDKTITHRMVSNSFGGVRDITNNTTNEVRYQHRGYGHYFEIVNLFGWCPLRNFWKQESIDFDNGINHGINDQNNDRRIVRMSIAAKADLRPLFHVFGIIAQDSVFVQDTLAQVGILPSLTVYNRLQNYFNLLPTDSASFVAYALSVYPDLFIEGPTAPADYGVGWHYLKSLSYNTAQAQTRSNILQYIINKYFPTGQPTGNVNIDVCCLLDTMQINLVNNQVAITGGVAPYNITSTIVGNTSTVNVIDFDGCEATKQYNITSLPTVEKDAIKVYPNPASTEIFIDVLASNYTVKNVQIYSVHGQLVHKAINTNRINVATLTEGIYTLQLQLSNGKKTIKKILILR